MVSSAAQLPSTFFQKPSLTSPIKPLAGVFSVLTDYINYRELSASLRLLQVHQVQSQVIFLRSRGCKNSIDLLLASASIPKRFISFPNIGRQKSTCASARPNNALNRSDVTHRQPLHEPLDLSPLFQSCLPPIATEFPGHLLP